MKRLNFDARNKQCCLKVCQQMEMMTVKILTIQTRIQKITNVYQFKKSLIPFKFGKMFTIIEYIYFCNHGVTEIKELLPYFIDS